MDDRQPTKICSLNKTSSLFLGSRQHAKSKEILQQLNITFIMNCTPPRTVDPDCGCPNFFEKDKSVIYKRIPIFDNKGEDILPHMNTAFEFIEHGKHYGSILVHCHKGISRSASFVIGYLMRKNEFTFEEALRHVQNCRPVIQPNESFLTQLVRYDTILQESRRAEEQEAAKYGTVISITDNNIGPAAGPSVVKNFEVEGEVVGTEPTGTAGETESDANGADRTAEADNHATLENEDADPVNNELPGYKRQRVV